MLNCRKIEIKPWTSRTPLSTSADASIRSSPIAAPVEPRDVCRTEYRRGLVLRQSPSVAPALQTLLAESRRSNSRRQVLKGRATTEALASGFPEVVGDTRA